MTGMLGKLVLHFLLTNAKSFKTFMMLFLGRSAYTFCFCCCFCYSRFCCVPIWPAFDEIIFAPNSQSIVSVNWKGHSACSLLVLVRRSIKIIFVQHRNCWWYLDENMDAYYYMLKIGWFRKLLY